MFEEEHTEEERREVSRKVKTWRQNSSRRAQNSDSPLLLSEERHAEEKETERERERERVEFRERAATEYPHTRAKNVRVRVRVENLPLETSPDRQVLVSPSITKLGANDVVSSFSRERDGMPAVRVHADGRGGVREVSRVTGDENELWFVHHERRRG